MDASFSGCGAGNARSGDTEFVMASSSIVTVPVVDLRLQYGPSLRGSYFEQKSVASRLVDATASGRPSMLSPCPVLKVVVACPQRS